jgi:ketosteroid isomerase-like protein
MGVCSMSHPDQSLRPSIVELAMARTTRQKARSDTPSPEAKIVERSLGRRIYDETLPHRVNPAHSVTGKDQSLSSEASPQSEPDPAIALRTKPIPYLRIATHFISAATGAVVMWFVMSEPVRTPIPTPSAATVTVAAVAPSVLETKSSTPPTAVPANLQVSDMLERWRQAWSNRDIDAYLGFYSARFVPADGTKRSVWAEGRRKNFLSRVSISVGIHDVKIIPIGSQQVKITLLQDYASGSYQETRQPKTFLLTREGGDWRIAGEWQGDHSPLLTTQE